MSKRWTKLTPATARRLGYVAIIAGSALLYEGYENSGKDRPFLTKFLPGA